jgi:hypothetical protein
LQETLRQGVTRNNCFFVFLFDQFEEFFFEEKSPEERRSFYEFLQFCIDQPWVKVVLTLREDYLHHLLEVERVVNQVGPMTTWICSVARCATRWAISRQRRRKR